MSERDAVFELLHRADVYIRLVTGSATQDGVGRVGREHRHDHRQAHGLSLLGRRVGGAAALVRYVRLPADSDFERPR